MSEGRIPERSRLLWTACAAIVAHAVAYASVRRLEVGARTALPITDTAPELVVEVDDVPSAPPPEAPAAAEREEPPSRPEPARIVSEVRRGDHAPVNPDSPQPPSVESSSAGTWTFSPSTGGSAQATGPLAGHALEAAVHAGIDATLAQDRQADARRSRIIPVFMPSCGELSSLGRDIARRSRVPDGSRATLQFDTNAEGVVVAFRVLEVSSAYFEWEEVAQSIATASREKPAIRVPPVWRGLAITLDVSCELRTVDGATSRDLFDKATHLPLLRIATARVVEVSPF